MIVKRLQFDPEFEPLLTAVPVIKFRTMRAVEQASTIIKQAQAEAEKFKVKSDEIYRAAEQHYEDERRRGYEDGREDGRAEWVEKLVEAGMAKEKMLEEAEPQVIRMVMDIAEKVIGRAVEKGAIIDVIKKAMEESAGRKVVVKVNAADWEKVKEREHELTSALDQKRSISIREDESVGAGGCIVETELGTVDARLEIQLKAIKNALGLK